jgi:RING-variant domain
MSSEDSDTVLLNSSTDQIPNPTSTDQTFRPPPPSRSSTLGIKKCWICIGDSTEDDPINPPVWRAPCSCNLTAHESCLLDWVADLENPKKGARKAATKITCPQCKSEIRISRPKSYIVDTTRAVDRTLGGLVWPGLGMGIIGTFYTGAWVHGFQSVLIVFGPEHAMQIYKEATKHTGWLSTYALIPVHLIMSRTNYADFVLPMGTLFLISTQITDRFEIDMTIYPPLPSTVFAILPTIRSFYNWSYNKAFGELNQKWLAEVQPQQMEPIEGQEDNPADIANEEEEAAREGQVLLELEVNVGGGEDDDEDDLQPNNGGGAEGNAADNGNNNQNGNGEHRHVHHILGERGGDLIATSSGIGQTILGALTFPAVAASMGGLLSLVIPQAWMTNTNWMNGRPGLLRHRWGRSVVGGCLFVVLKDALVLYCRWRLVQSHRQRRIMDYDKVAKRYVL